MNLTAQRQHLVAVEGVAISLRAATMVLLLPSSALIACISLSSLAMPCSTCPLDGDITSDTEERFLQQHACERLSLTHK